MDTYNEHWKNFAETQPPVEVPSLHGAEQYLTPVDRWHKLIGGGFLAALAVATVAQIFVLHLPLRTHFPTPKIAAASLLTSTQTFAGAISRATQSCAHAAHRRL